MRLTISRYWFAMDDAASSHPQRGRIYFALDLMGSVEPSPEFLDADFKAAERLR